jgi:hypothetical protein
MMSKISGPGRRPATCCLQIPSQGRHPATCCPQNPEPCRARSGTAMGQMLWDAYGAPPQSAPHDLTDCDRAGITHQRPFVGRAFTKLTFPRAPGRLEHDAHPNAALRAAQHRQHASLLRFWFSPCPAVASYELASVPQQKPACAHFALSCAARSYPKNLERQAALVTHFLGEVW